MPAIMERPANLDTAAAQTIAAAMREVARADGNHPREEALIASFAEGLPPGGTVDLGTIRTAEQREAFVKSLLLVAFADGAVSPVEGSVIRGYIADLGLSESDLAQATSDVAQALLGQLSGAHIFRAAVVDLGRAMGLSDEAIEASLA